MVKLGLAQTYPIVDYKALGNGNIIEDADGNEYEIERFYIADNDHMVIFLIGENDYRFMVDVERDKEAFETPGGVEELIKWIKSVK